MGLWAELLFILLLTTFNGVFTGAEIAMLSVRKTRLQELADDGSASATAALDLRRRPEALLATVQIGITVIGATTAVFGGARLEAPLSGLFSAVGFGGAADGAAFVVVIVFVSYLSLVLGELVPKSLALRAPERYALAVARPLAGLATLSRPLVWLLTASSNLVLRPFRDRTTFSESRLSPAELQQLIEESSVAGALDEGTAEIASRAMDLGRLRANALMVPRPRVIALHVDATEREVVAALGRTPHARYPVFESHVEEIIGYVLARELYDALRTEGLSIRRLLRPVSFLPETMLAIEVLRTLQSSRQQLAVLVEARGGIAGLITIEDIAEEVLGEILEEQEVPRPLAWLDEADASVVALGEAPIHEVARLLGEDLTEGDASVTTIAGLLAQLAGRVPTVGDKLMLTSRVEAEVLEATPRHIGRVRLRRTRVDAG